MRLIVQKLFMVQTHQLRKWGKLTAGVMFALAAFCVGAAIVVHRLVIQMKEGMKTLADSDQEMIATVPVPGDVRSTLLESFEQHMAINTDLLEALSTVPVGLAGVGLLAVVAALLALRSGELAGRVTEAGDNGRPVNTP